MTMNMGIAERSIDIQAEWDVCSGLALKAFIKQKKLRFCALAGMTSSREMKRETVLG